MLFLEHVEVALGGEHLLAEQVEFGLGIRDGALLQQLNGLYSMPVLAIFVVAVLFSRVNGMAARYGLVFGALLYAVFTFLWSPLHYIHLMFITLVATIAFILALSRLLPAPAAAAR